MTTTRKKTTKRPVTPQAYLDKIAAYFSKNRKPLKAEVSQSGTMHYLVRDDWKTAERGREHNEYDLTISWSASEPTQVAVSLYGSYGNQDKQRWFPVGTTPVALYQFARDPWIGTIGRQAGYRNNPSDPGTYRKRTAYGSEPWKRSSHAAGFGMDYKAVSPQKARSLLTQAQGSKRALPTPGHEIRLDQKAVLVNWGGQYEVRMM